jgi:hypothetical protein
MLTAALHVRAMAALAVTVPPADAARSIVQYKADEVRPRLAPGMRIPRGCISHALS